jgi:hypothetical protein
MTKHTTAKTQDRYHARTHPMWAIDRSAMKLCEPDLTDLPHPQIDKRTPGRPDWFQRIVWDCQAAARRCAEIAAYPYDFYDDGPGYDAAYLVSYAEWLPKLLAKALATREPQPYD